MTAPVRIFALFRHALAIKKGALLVPDPDGAYFSPWSSVGYDQTTEHRMRLSESRLPRGEQSGNLEEFRSYFSVREFSMLEEIFLYPFVAEDTTVALLLLTDSPYLRDDRRYLSVICAAVSDAVAALIFDNREERIRSARYQASFTIEELGNHVDELAQEEREATTFVMLSATKAVGALVQEGDKADEYRLRQDVIRVISAMVSGIASIADMGDGRVLLALYDGEKYDLDLIVHQLSHQVGELFPEMAGEEKFTVETLPSPPAEGSVVDHLRSLVS